MKIIGVIMSLSLILSACGAASSAALPAPPPPISVPAGAASAASALGKAAGIAGVVVSEANRAAVELAGTSTESVEGGWMLVYMLPPPGWVKQALIKTTVEDSVDVGTGTVSVQASYTCESKSATVFMRLKYTDKQSGATFTNDIARSFETCKGEKPTIKQIANELKQWFSEKLLSEIKYAIKSIEGAGPADVRRAELAGWKGLNKIVGGVITTLSKIAVK